MGTKNKILIRDSTFDDGRISSGSCYIGSSLACDELGIDTLSVTLDGSTDDLTQYRYGEPVYYYHGDTLVGKFYLSSVVRVGKRTYALTCTSAIGLLDGTTHYGGIYAGQTMKEVLSDIVGGMVEYTLDPALAKVATYGWLPVATRRENLHQLLFATGASVRKGTAGALEITTLSAGDTLPISDDRQAMGGRIEYPAHATRADVTEHAYLRFSGDERATLYEGDVVASPITSPRGTALTGALVTFDGPMHDLQIEGGSILERGVNYAVLGPGLGCKLTGQKYTHTTQVVTAEQSKSRALAEIKDKTVSVTDATLVSLANSWAVAKRVLDYYGAVRTIHTSIVVGKERPGDAVSLTDPYGDPTEGLVSAMDINLSGLLVASTDIAVGYVPSTGGDVYTQFVVLTSSGTFAVPEGTTKIRIVLVGAGSGGGAGTGGQSGGSNAVSATIAELKKGGVWSTQAGAGGNAGIAGAPGVGGKVYQTVLNVKPGQKFTYSSGVAGVGGKSSGAKGTAGTATVFGGYSSELGTSGDIGYTNIMSEVTYARKGTPGKDGGKGGRGGSASGSDAKDGEDGGAVSPQRGGTGASGSYHPSSLSKNVDSTGGGGGGGAAKGTNGGNAPGSGYWANENAGDGASAGNVAQKKNPGDGGDGGSGGGGGGGAGGFYMYVDGQGIKAALDYHGIGGRAGAYSPGVDGAPGCAIIFF